MKETKTGLEKLREPFPAHQISKLPKPTKQQTDAVKTDFRNGMRCQMCGGWHHKDVVHLDYVGHAALTDRLLDCDPSWSWEPLAYDDAGLPRLDKDGGMWIKLTVCGVTRLGYGDAQGKSGGDAMKERIGDALRNAGMRFGAALELWHKGELHIDEPEHIQHASSNDVRVESAEECAQRPTAVERPLEYTQQRFDSNLPGWADAILTRGKTADFIIQFAESRGGKMSDEQKQILKDIENKKGEQA